nr:ribosomal protein S6 kinase alpha 2 [Hymenolepis microstoma]
MLLFRVFRNIYECNILKRIALDPHASPFLPTLYFGFIIHGSPALVITEAMGITLDDIVGKNGPLTVEQTKFYLSELICGLKYLHSNGIVHMELKSNNILLTKTGHTLISDFDRSYDLMESDRPSIRKDFIIHLAYAALEIANKSVITERADIWSLGVLTASLIGKFIRPKSMDPAVEKQAARAGLWEIAGFSRLSRDSQDLTLFRDVNWNKVEQLRIKPPFSHLLLKTYVE